MPAMTTLAFLTGHPLTRDRPLAALARFARWQMQSRMRPEIVVDWIEGSRLAARRGMTGATGNIYCGLHEFADMAFVLHLLRPGDLFVDVGANIGSYTVLASAVCRAETIAVEPDPGTAAFLHRNIQVNGIEPRVTVVEAALGQHDGVAQFTVGLDTTNKIAPDGDQRTREVRVRRMDDLLQGRAPTLIKLDVEGFEPEVIAGGGQTLSNPSLLAVETESRDPGVIAALHSAGFEEVFYDPSSRRFVSDGRWTENNALFVRDRDACLARLSSARPFRVLGHVL